MNISRRDFFIGLGAGIAATIFSLFLAFAGLVLIGKKAIRNPKNQLTVLPVLHFPEQLTNYGQPRWNWTLLTLDGKAVDLSEFRGKVMFVNFWATWCEPCRAELLAIQKLYDKMKSEPVSIVLISDEDAETVRTYIAERHFSFPVYRAEEKRPRVFEDPRIPVTFILSPAGMVVFKCDGAAEWDSDTTVDFIKRLMQPNAPGQSLPEGH